MRYLVCYDTPSDSRRTRLATILSGYGERVQFSVFECDCTPRRLEELLARIDDLVAEQEDAVRVYATCGPCLERLVLFGRRARQDNQVAWIV